MTNEFYDIEPTLQNYWRGVILFGRNVASYKFALGKSLLELAKRKHDFVTMEELAEPFSRYMVEHVNAGRRQATSQSSQFLDACRSFGEGRLAKDELISRTTQLGFQNVIDAFHIVNGKEIPKRFFQDERTGARPGIRLTENLFELQHLDRLKDLPSEVEARWNLVETAWDLKVSRQLISINHDERLQEFFVLNQKRRVAVTSSRDALNGYQKGRCFYCFRKISINPGSQILAHVDHFYPHVLKRHEIGCNVDGVWNLVLACSDCNGAGGKGAKVPETILLERLNQRNEYLIGSNHPLKETIITQTGDKARKRAAFLQDVHNRAKTILIHSWLPKPKADPTF